MEFNPLKAPELLAEYLSFLVAFTSKPRDALRPYADKNSIDGKLLTFAVLAIVLSWILLSVVRALGASEDYSYLLRVANSLPIWMLPCVAVLLIFAVAVVFHFVATKLVPLWAEFGFKSSGTPSSPHLGGTLWDSINAAFGFAAFHIPLIFLGYAITLLLVPQFNDVSALIVVMSVALAIFGTLLYYFPSALSGTHSNTSFRQAAAALTTSITILVIIQILVERFAELLRP